MVDRGLVEVALHLAERASTAEVHLGRGHREACLCEEVDHVIEGGRRQVPHRRADQRNEHHKDQRRHGIVTDHLERAVLPEELPVVEPEDDVGNDPQLAFGKQLERAFEVAGRQVEVVDVADRLVGTDDVEHHAVDAGIGEPFGELR